MEGAYFSGKTIRFEKLPGCGVRLGSCASAAQGGMRFTGCQNFFDFAHRCFLIVDDIQIELNNVTI
jgi:hypothetical protein